MKPSNHILKAALLCIIFLTLHTSGHTSVISPPIQGKNIGDLVLPMTKDPVCPEGGEAEACQVETGGGGGGGGSWPGGGGGNGRDTGGIGGGGGGGGGGSGGGGSRSDGTTGKSMDNNRTQPGCSREYDFMQATIDQIHETGKPVGTQVPIIVTDPNYPDGQWLKYQAIGIDHYLSADNPGVKIVFKFNMHYMYNVTTGQVHQTKLKNSYEYDCIGFKEPA